MPQYLVTTKEGVTIHYITDPLNPNMRYLAFADHEATFGTGWVSNAIMIEPYTATPPPPEPPKIVPSHYKFLVDRNMRSSADLQSIIVATPAGGDIVRVLSNDAPVADGYIWRNVEKSEGDESVVGWIAISYANGAGKWVEPYTPGAG